MTASTARAARSGCRAARRRKPAPHGTPRRWMPASLARAVAMALMYPPGGKAPQRSAPVVRRHVHADDAVRGVARAVDAPVAQLVAPQALGAQQAGEVRRAE